MAGWIDSQERLPPDARVTRVKLVGEKGTGLGAYHRNEGIWHIWRPGSKEWTDVPGTVSHWDNMWSDDGGGRFMTKWEYKVLILCPKEPGETLADMAETHERQLGNLGPRGWELVALSYRIAYLKRPIEEKWSE